MKAMNLQMKRMTFVLAASLFATAVMAQSHSERAYKKAWEKAHAAEMAAQPLEAPSLQDERRLKPGDKGAMKQYQQAIKKESKSPSSSLSTLKSLAKDGYAPAQYRLY